MRKFSIGRLIVHIILVLLSLACIIPILFLLSISLSSEESITQYGYTFIPKIFSLEAYRMAFANPTEILDAYKVTSAFSVLAVILSLIIQSMVAYPISKPNYKFKKITTVYIFITMLFSGGLVPSYIINTQYLHLGDSFWIYILPSLVGAWNIIVMRTFFQGLPAGLTEAAKIDGANEFQIYSRMILPLSLPVLATLGFMSLLAKWNDWNTSLIYIRNPKLYSLQYLLQRILREAEYVKKVADTSSASFINTDSLPIETYKYAMCILASGPMLVVFPFFQRYFTRGLTIGAIKG